MITKSKLCFMPWFQMNNIRLKPKICGTLLHGLSRRKESSLFIGPQIKNFTAIFIHNLFKRLKIIRNNKKSLRFTAPRYMLEQGAYAKEFEDMEEQS